MPNNASNVHPSYSVGTAWMRDRQTVKKTPSPLQNLPISSYFEQLNKLHCYAQRTTKQGANSALVLIDCGAARQHCESH